MRKTQDRNHEGIFYYTLENANSMSVTVTNYGATITSILAPDKSKNIDEVILTYDDVSGFINGKCYFGATVGRYANRIVGGRFELGGREYKLVCNDGPNNLHGGNIGFDKMVWTEEQFTDNSVSFSYLSKDGEEGFPGNLKAEVKFSLDDDNNLKLLFRAVSDKDTVVNLTNHSYFNLAGHTPMGHKQIGSIEGHVLQIDADNFTPVDKFSSATGEIASVTGTPFDFREPTPIGQRMHDDNEQLKFGSGYDHNYVLNGSDYRFAAKVFEPNSGRTLSVFTDKPCMQLYSGNFLDGEKGKDGAVYNKHDAFCLETQFAPDSPNQPEFDSPVLKVGEVYQYTTCFKFGTE